MKELYQLKTSPRSRNDAIVVGRNYRFTILTPSLIRMEYDENGIFEDRATQAVICRDFPIQSFEKIETEDELQIITKALHLTYNKKEFTKDGLSIKLINNPALYYAKWNYTDKCNNLKGTARTLDGANGGIELEDGILSRDGFSIIDDSSSLIIREDGFVEARREGIVDLYFFGYGREYYTCLKDFYKLTSETPLLSKFALGNWWSRFHKYTEASYKELIHRFCLEEIPFTVSVIDLDWHLVNIDPKYGSGWTGYTWNKEFFPDPASFMKWLHEKGLRITLNVHPADGVRGHEEMYLPMAKELGVNYELEEPIVFDVTNIAFLKAYFKYLHHKNEEDGVDFWWIDWQQGSSSKIQGLDPLWMLNHFHYLDNLKTGKRGLIFSRYAGVGSHRYPIGFSGDSIITWDSLDFQPYFTANASNIGYSWWSHDIGGHMNGVKDDELATRWLQFGVFSPIMRLHSSGSLFTGKEPWHYSKDCHEIMNDFLRLRHRLLPYLYTMNYRTSFEGKPLISPMYYLYSEKQEAYEIRNQYYFGSELMVAPITSPMDLETQLGAVKVWLPEGIYIDFFTGTIYRGNRFMNMYRELSMIPVLAKGGAIVPMNAAHRKDNSLENPSELSIKVFAGSDGSFTLYEDDGESLDYLKGSFVTTKMSLNWNSEYNFIIEAAVGTLDLIPEKRSYTLEFIGFEPMDEIEVFMGSSKEASDKLAHVIRDSSNNQSISNRICISVADVDVKKGLLVEFKRKPIVSVNKKDVAIFTLLDRARISYDLKDRIYNMVKSNQDTYLLISELNTMDMNRQLYNGICEILLAN